MTKSLELAAAAAFVVALSACVAMVLTQDVHGRLTLDSDFGVQKFHKAPTPRIGGVAVLAGIALSYAFAPRQASALLGPMLIASIPAFAAGFAEDLTKKVGVFDRLAATMFSGALGWWLTGAVVQHTGVAALDSLLGHLPFAIAFTAFGVSGMANAVNIIDGFHGLAGGVVIIMLAALGAIAVQVGDTSLATVCVLVAAGVLGFLVINWPSGKIFLGDGGAYLLGFLVGWIAVSLVARHPQLSPWGPLLACAYPVLEVAFSSYRKSRRVGSSPGQPDRVHLHMLVHRRLVRTRLAVRSARLQNALTSPFAWLYAGATAVWATLMWHQAAALIAGFAVAGLAYWLVYTRLAKFRWWLPQRRVQAPGSARPDGTYFTARNQGLWMFAREPTRGPSGPARSRARYRPARPEWNMSRLMYLLLGASSCIALIEPAPFELIALLLMFAQAMRHLEEPWWKRIGPLTATVILLLILFSILQVVPVALQAQSPAKSAFYAAVTTMLIMIGVHLGQLHGRGDARFSDFLAGYAVGAFASAVLALASLHPAVAAVGGDILLWEGRPKVFFKDPNVFGPFLVPATLIFLEAAGRRRGAGVLLFILFALACAAGVVASASRAAWVNLAVAITLYGLLCSMRQKAILAFAAVLAVAATVALAGLLPDVIGTDALDLYIGRTQLQEYDNDRFEMARGAFEIGLRYPAGVGPGEIAGYLGFGPGMDPHNTYVRIWAENGPVGMMLFAAVLLLLLAHALQEFLARRMNTAFACAFALLAGALVNASVVDTLHWRHFWILLAVCLFSFSGGALRRRGEVVRT